MTISTQNGLRLFRDIDYLYRSQLDQTVPMRQSGIILRRFVYNDTQINVVVYPNYTYNMDYPSLSIEDTFDDKYGLLYLGNLKFPFSSKYMDVYANNKHLGEDDIDIISNKLIRLTKSEVSLQDVCIETNFTVPYSALRPFIQLYFDSNFETCIGKLFSCYDYYNNPQIGVVSKASADSLYESFGDEVLTNDSTQLTVQEWVSNILYNINDIVIYNDIIYICSTQNINNIPSGSSKWVVRGKLPNPIRTQEYITTEYNLYVDAYLRWFIGNYSKHIWEDNVNIPDNVLTELQIFRDNSEGDNLDVVVIPYENQLIADIVIDTNPDTYLGFYNGESEKVFLDCCIDNNLLPQDAYDQYDNYIESNIVSKRDLFPIRAIDTFVGDDIIIGGRQ